MFRFKKVYREAEKSDNACQAESDFVNHLMAASDSGNHCFGAGSSQSARRQKGEWNACSAD
jgi:hypothetical protein